MGHFEEDALVDALTGMLPRVPTGLRRVAGGGVPLKIIPLRALGIVLASVLVVSLTTWFVGSIDRTPRPGPAALATVQTSASGNDSVTANDKTVIPAAASRTLPPRIASSPVGRGGTLMSTLDRLGVPKESRAIVVQTVGRFLDPRRLLPRTAVAAAFPQNPNADSYSVTVRNEPERFLRVTVRGRTAPFDVRAEVVRLPIVTELERVGGIVQSSVAQALAHSPHGVTLTNAFADVFQWDVDLLVDPRPGDAVRVAYEAHRLGRPAIDMPALLGGPNEQGELVTVGRILAASYEGRVARSEGFWLSDKDGIGSYFDSDGKPLRKTFLKSPLNYRRISSGFSRGRYHPVLRKVVPHHGVDFAAAAGTPVVATADGVVVSAGWDGPLGRAIRIRHGSSYVTVYGHLKGFAGGIGKGAEVQQDQVIGYVGSTGRATGPHLHYTMLRAGRAIDPMTFKSPTAAPLPTEGLTRLDEAKRRWRPFIGSIPGMDGHSIATTTLTARQIREGA